MLNHQKTLHTEMVTTTLSYYYKFVKTLFLRKSPILSQSFFFVYCPFELEVWGIRKNVVRNPNLFSISPKLISYGL
jgi:hypothetical protein